MPRATELVGRERELDELTRLLDDAAGRRGRSALLVGEPGIGKTSLAEEVAVRARDRGFRVAWGRCPVADAPAYWPWAQVLTDVTGDDDLLGRGSFGTREELAATVAESLAAAAAYRPLLVVVEDVHWIDAGSAALLEFLLGSLGGQPLLVLVSSREEAAGLATPGVRRFDLTGLGREGTARLVHGILGDVSDEYVDEVQRRTAGNPYFATEVARLQVSRGGHDGTVPAGVRQVLEQRLARLPQATVELLQLGSVVGAPEAGQLARVNGLGRDEVTRLLAPAADAGVISGDAFTHDLMRETLYEGLGPQQRAVLHRRAAEHLQAAGPADLARHWSLADGPEARARAAELSVVAGDVAAAGLAHEQAARHYRDAVTWGRGSLDVRRRLGEALVHAGRIDDGRDVLRRVAREAGISGAGEELALAVLAMGGGVGGFEVDVFDGAQPALLEQALEVLPETDTALRAAVLARLSLARAAVAPPEARAALAEEAVAMAARVGAVEAEVGALAALCDARSGPEHVDARLVAADRMLGLAGGNALLELLARRLRIRARLERGDLTGADADVAAYAVVAGRLRSATYGWPVVLWRGMAAVQRGDLATGAAYAAELGSLAAEAGSENARLMGWALEWSLARERVDQEEIRRLIEVIVALPQHGSDCTFALLFAQAGEPERARHHLDRLLASGLDTIPRNSEYLEHLWCAGDAALLVGHGEAAALVRDALLPHADLWAVDGYGAALFGRVGDLVDRLAGPVATSAARPAAEGVFVLEGKLRRVDFRGRPATLPEAKGLRDLAVLLARPGHEVHVLELVEATGGAPAALVPGGLGPVLDGAARNAYARRLQEIEDELDAAAADHDEGQVDRLTEEKEFLLAELGAALGLGGRARIAADPAERARKAVTMRIGTALKAIDAVHPELGRHLHNSVSTGRFCCYRPEEPVVWRT